MKNRYLCIHGHFYQPPREDPLINEIPIEESAMPFRNWNEKIDAECYRPNAELENFRRISFNVGPTLFEWLEPFDPQTYKRIIEQDHDNVKKHKVGNAIAQAYNHSILPLANHRDKVTQVKWGIEDFRHRFGHTPQGMWLPETAVDMETLSVLAEQKIQFTILAPWQAKTSNIDPRTAYDVALPDGKRIAVFFFHPGLSNQISFDPQVTENADTFMKDHLMPSFDASDARPQLITIATDGEFYGHHQHFRDKFLARLTRDAIDSQNVQLTFPALWLKEFPSRPEVQIKDNTAWSCQHGLARWSKECACTPGATWKKPMRKAFDNMAAELDALYEAGIKPLVSKPWELRDDYIEVLLGNITINELLREYADRKLDKEETWQVKTLLEAQRERMRMFTSCGWFFDKFNRIEPRNNIAYAAQAVWLTKLVTGSDISGKAMKWLQQIPSNGYEINAPTIFSVHLRFAQSYYRKVMNGMHQ